MDFQAAVKSCILTNYATFSGRASRSEFWFFQLFLLLVNLVAMVIDAAILKSDLGVLATIFSIATLVPNIAVACRRLHDIDKSGWWQLLWLIPLVGMIVLLIWYITKSDVTDNRFGPAAAAAPQPAAA
ncbi:DUF805 domain-containing protein [Magnetospirillum sulfuroxidans]|uniref:DUF805 domain-containing protein n=1 Tax=Magnetospirillum sulfuroxidans TaxID=611300 RepID=A0ABS5IDM6_9PROT|nr:DUF805 domain-containing protein [Magnetospirillum sulfuroxidans]MBR9972376.1 DUF805 domain-containing protein [Magnetospirillum sulfuroxidans]